MRLGGSLDRGAQAGDEVVNGVVGDLDHFALHEIADHRNRRRIGEDGRVQFRLQALGDIGGEADGVGRRVAGKRE